MIEYNKILVHYIAHIARVEGYDFLGRTTPKDLGLNEAEFNALVKASEDAAELG